MARTQMWCQWQGEDTTATATNATVPLNVPRTKELENLQFYILLLPLSHFKQNTGYDLN